jgi:hypothetical protein
VKYEATFFYEIRYSAVKSLRIDIPTELASEVRNNSAGVREKVIVPPPENLRRFIAAGADLVVYSGGKAIGAPAASGMLAGRRDLVLSATAQQQDMYVRPGSWPGPQGGDTAAILPEPPQQPVGRLLEVAQQLVRREMLVIGIPKTVESEVVKRFPHLTDDEDRKAVTESISTALEALNEVNAAAWGVSPQAAAKYMKKKASKEPAG